MMIRRDASMIGKSGSRSELCKGKKQQRNGKDAVAVIASSSTCGFGMNSKRRRAHQHQDTSKAGSYEPIFVWQQRQGERDFDDMVTTT
mmetsp:Transcript_20026/g.56774  ORF Transcript_20026/g.56774 Transcript_20026/m.56774 type:complete len:88 (+) Transcript_20026:2121-2384(+)